MLEFSLHPANPLKKGSLNDFLKTTATGRDGRHGLVEPKLQLSLAVHRDNSKKRTGWHQIGKRGSAWNGGRANTKSAACDGSHSLRAASKSTIGDQSSFRSGPPSVPPSVKEESEDDVTTVVERAAPAVIGIATGSQSRKVKDSDPLLRGKSNVATAV